MDLRCQLVKAVLAISETARPLSSDTERPRVRLRSSRGANTNTHDTRTEAVDYFVQQVVKHGVPLWAALPLGYRFADTYTTELHSKVTPFADDRYETIIHSQWSVKALNLIQQFLHLLGTGQDPLPEKPKGWDDVLISLYENRNHKKEMEDKKIILPKLSVIEPSLGHGLNDASLLAVFDGHGGHEVATYATIHTPSCIVNHEQAGDPDFFTNALREVEKRVMARIAKEQTSGGSTAVVVLLRPDLIDYAWIGDSAIGALTGDKIITLTTPHNLKDPAEVERVKESGGLIMNIYGEDRVNGVLNITRAFGDYNAKPMVSAEPGYGQFKPSETGYYLLFLASDGVWDYISEEKIYNTIVEFVQTQPQSDYELLSQAIGKLAQLNSPDNMMLITVFLKSPAEIWNHFGGAPVQAGPGGDVQQGEEP